MGGEGTGRSGSRAKGQELKVYRSQLGVDWEKVKKTNIEGQRGTGRDMTRWSRPRAEGSKLKIDTIIFILLW